jgi:hypothetical protein
MQIFFELTAVPVHQNLLYATQAAAQHIARGDIKLGFCSACGFIANCTFDATLLNYSAFYDNTQCFSPTFNKYVVELAKSLIDRYHFHEKQIIEIGCGKGDFIKLLSQLGNNQGVGFDPSYIGDEIDLSGSVRFIKDFYSEAYAGYTGNLFCSRHVIEHISQPSEVFVSLRKAIGVQKDTAIFFETPDVTWILRNLTFWDIFYEHRSLFSPGSIARLAAQHGFDTTHLQLTFGGQYMCSDSVPSAKDAGEILVDVEDIDTMFGHINFFTTHYQQKLEETQSLIERIKLSGKRTVIWGAGAKAVTFLNTLNIQPNVIPYVVDINPRKQRMFIAGTGQEIVAPNYLNSFAPDTILVINPNYADEIYASATTMELIAEIVVL